MSQCYQEIVAGQRVIRAAPCPRHEMICLRLHEWMVPQLADLPHLRPLTPRTAVRIPPNTLLRPDLTVVRADTGQPWLIGEVVDAVDHLTDTVMKKSVYEDIRLPRLWMIDPRYGNVEVYRASSFGIALREILAGNESLGEPELTPQRLCLRDLFAE